MNKRTMKKGLAIVLALVMVFAMSTAGIWTEPSKSFRNKRRLCEESMMHT